VQARLADETWLPFLTGRYGDAVVESGHRRAVNVCLANGDLLWLAAVGAPQAPNALLTDAADFASVEARQRVRVMDTATLAVGELTVDLRGCRTFSCQVAPSGPVDDVKVLAGREIATRALANCAVAGGLVQLEHTSADADAFTKATHAGLLAGAADLQEAVASQDVASAVAAARALIGLGIGSTPSGDDYILGCLAVLFLHSRTHKFGRRLAVGLRRWCDNTTAVSRSYLLAACDGRFHADLADAIEMIFLGEQFTIRRGVERVIAIGATSGTDSMVGILDTVKTLSTRPRDVDFRLDTGA
jgi:hypothetical protein